MDPELEAIRAQRMAELQQNSANSGMGESRQMSKEEQEKRLQQQEEMRNNILTQVLDQQARARLNTIALAKPEKAKMVENMLLNMATSGQLPGKLNEKQLVGLLERVNEQTKRTMKVKFDRRRTQLDSDSD